MAIRMEKDDPQGPRKNNNDPRRSGGANALLRWLPLILLFVFKKPKLLIPILLIGGIWYFFLGGQEMLSGGYTDPNADQFFFGATLSEEEYDKAQVFEPLSYGSNVGQRLPASVSLQQYAPPRLQQGRQGSCVGWASAYAARTILEAKETGQDPQQIAFSPAYLYNQIALQGCQGAYMRDAMEAMQQNGAVPFQQFRYDERSCSREPGGNLIQLGRQFRIKGFTRLTTGANNYQPDITGIKQHLAQGAPVVIGMQVGGTFMSRMVSQKVWRPTQRDRSLYGFSGHAMCVIGYDDNLEGGAFQIMNSWGPQWGDRGIAWVRYPDFQGFVKEAYGIYPTTSSNQPTARKMAVEFGLLDNESQSIIALQQVGDYLFQTVRPISKSDKFKVLVANTVECYIYVFGQESDGSSSVLFPYTSKHSPYCGITGTRLFPKDYSMTPDDVGNQDYIAVVVSKEPLQYDVLNSRMNNSRQRSYAGKLREALDEERITNVQFQANSTVSFNASTGDKNAVGMVIAIDKR